jgi:ribosomal protein S17
LNSEKNLLSGNKFSKGMVVTKSHTTPDTLKVAIRVPITDKRYKKRTWSSKYLMVHDKECITQVGDLVLIKEGRPISAAKTHTLVSVLTPFRGHQ